MDAAEQGEDGRVEVWDAWGEAIAHTSPTKVYFSLRTRSVGLVGMIAKLCVLRHEQAVKVATEAFRGGVGERNERGLAEVGAAKRAWTADK